LRGSHSTPGRHKKFFLGALFSQRKVSIDALMVLIIEIFSIYF